MATDNYLIISSLIGAIIGAISSGIVAFVQWNNANKVKRAEFINQMIEKFRIDKDMTQMMYKIQYDEGYITWYNGDFHGGSETEVVVDKLLTHLSYICYLKKTRNITREEFNIFNPEVINVLRSYNVQSYLWNIYQHTDRSSKKNCIISFLKKPEEIAAFKHLIAFGITNNIFPKDFLSKETKYYKKNESICKKNSIIC